MFGTATVSNLPPLSSMPTSKILTYGFLAINMHPLTLQDYIQLLNTLREVVACSLLPGGYPASRVVALAGLPPVADYSEAFPYRCPDNIVDVGSITLQCNAMLTSTGR
jgi:hypothetical protein